MIRAGSFFPVKYKIEEKRGIGSNEVIPAKSVACVTLCIPWRRAGVVYSSGKQKFA